MNLNLCIVVLGLLEKLLKGLKIEENYGTGHTYKNELSKFFLTQSVFPLLFNILKRNIPLREKCPNTELFLVRISCIQTEYGYLLTE